MAACSIPIVRASADLDGTSKRAYQLQSVEKYQQSDAKGSGKLPSLVIQTADIRTVADLFSYVKQKDKQFHPKPASKVVNDDGTPMVVYHGTSDTFWAFDVNEISHLEGNFFFAQKRESLRSMRPEFQHSVTDSTISIRSLLDYVKRYFPDVLPESVLRHYNHDRGRRGSWARMHFISCATTCGPTATCFPMLRTTTRPMCARPSLARAVRLSGLNMKAAAASLGCNRCFSVRFQ